MLDITVGNGSTRGHISKGSLKIQIGTWKGFQEYNSISTPPKILEKIWS